MNAVRSFDDDEEHGAHVPSRQADAAVVEWQLVHGQPEHAKVKDQTCECRATVFELCAAGGQRFVRRTTRGDGRPKVHESPRLISRQADALWRQVLTGAAR